MTPGSATLDASPSAPAGAIAARFDWKISGDRAGDIVCPASEPQLKLSAGAPLTRTMTLTAVDARTGAVTSAVHALRILAPAGGGESSVKHPLVTGLCSSPTSTLVPPLRTNRLTRGAPIVSAGGAPPSACGDDLVFGAIDVHGCLNEIPDPRDLPNGITVGLARLLCQAHASTFCLSELTAVATDRHGSSDALARRLPHATAPALSQRITTVITALGSAVVPSYYSWSAVRLDGIDIVPQGGVPLLIIPAADAIVASQVKLFLDGKLLTPTAIPLALYAPAAGGNLGQITLPHAIPLIGSLPFTGSISVDLHRAHSALADGSVCQYACAALTVAVQLPGVFTDGNGNGTSASGVITADAVNGVQLDSLEVMVGSAEVAGIGVSDLDIRYRSSDESLHAQATFDLFDAAGQITGTIDLVHGDFQDASVEWSAGDGPGIDLGGPLNIYLVKLGGSIALNPTTITANAALNGGPQTLGCALLGINGTATLQFSPFSFDATADGSLLCQPVAQEYFHYDDSGFFNFGGSVDLHFLFVEVMGGIDVAVDVPQGHFQFDGNVSACLDILGRHCLGAEVVLSDRGIGACADLGFTHAGGGIQFPDHPVVFFDSCDIGKFRSLGFVTALGRSPRSFTVPQGEHVAVIGLVGRGGAPIARLTGPDGRVIDTPADGYERTPTQVVVRDDADTRTTYFLIDHPAPGPWRVTPTPGSAPIETIEQAASLPQPEVHARVQPLRGGRERLTYAVRPIPGQTVTFAERAPDHSFRVIGRAHGDGGRLAFTPSVQLVRRRTILAMVSQYGHPRTDLQVARFRAPHPPRLQSPNRLRVRRDEAGLQLRWQPVHGVAHYLVSIRVSGAGTRHVLTTRPEVAVAGVPLLRATRVEVAARRHSRWADGPGISATVTLPAGRAPAPRQVRPERLRH